MCLEDGQHYEVYRWNRELEKSVLCSMTYKSHQGYLKQYIACIYLVCRS
jgi:hypothetical protein